MVRFRYPKARVSLAIGILLFLVFSPILIWYTLPKRPLHIVVVDKTVPLDNYREHSTLFWIFKHLKYVDPSDFHFYEREHDYYGYFPHDGTVSDSTAMGLDHADLLYLADTYGIYRDHNGKIVPDPAPDDTIPLSLVYGGINQKELEQIRDFAFSGGTLIGEFNCLAHPTSAPVRSSLEQLFGIHTTGIVGNYFERLQDVPLWIKRRHREQLQHTWQYSGSGIVLASERESSRGMLVVLDGSDISGAPVLHPVDGHPLLEDVANNVPYFYQFEIIAPDTTSTVLASFALRCKASGSEKLRRAGLPERFPAVVSRGSGIHSFYFAGDFADNEVETALTQVWNNEIVLRQIYYLYFVSDQTRFFWRFYLPLMKNILAAQYRRHSG